MGGAGEFELAILFGKLLGVIVLAQVSPGPDFVLVIRALGHGGPGAVARVALGIGAGLVWHCALVFGVAAGLVGEIPGAWHAAIMVVAGLWLMWLGWKTWPRRQSGGGSGGQGGGGGNCPGFREGFVNNFLNAKASAFMLAIFLPYTGPEYPVWWPWALSAMVVGEGVLGWIAMGWALSKFGFGQFLRKHARQIDMALAVVLGALGVLAVVNAI